MRVLVLGGSYFVGRHVALAFFTQGHEVVLLNRNTRPASFLTLTADRNDPHAMRAALAGQSFDVVVDTSGNEPGQVFHALQGLGGRYQRYLFVSSSAVYPDHAPRPLRESEDADGARSWGEFGVRKARTEGLLREICGPKLTVVRPGYIYGPFNSLARETFIWSRLLRAHPVFVPGDGSTEVSFVHARDLADILVALASHDDARGATLNVAHPETVTLERFVHASAAAASLCARVVHVPHGTVQFAARDYFPFRDQPLTLDVTALGRLGLLPRHDLERGLADTYRAYSRDTLCDMARESSVDLELSVALQVV